MVGFEKSRQAIESLYRGVCTITKYKPIFDETTKQTKFKEIVVLENQPCRLSFFSLKTTFQKQGASEVSQDVKLFLAPEIEISPGSKIIVTQNGKTQSYSKSGEAALYSSHQEIKLELWQKWV